MLNTCGCSVRVLVILGLLAGGATQARAEVVTTGRPDTIRISPELIPSITAMLQASPTFREQYQRIVTTPKLILNARTDMTFMHRAFRARSCMRRYDSGLLVVSMDIAPGAEQAEWLAHEFEHVLEQIEGLSLPTLAAHGHRETWFSSDQMVETSRATRAGRLVRAEMHERRERSDKFVQR